MCLAACIKLHCILLNIILILTYVQLQFLVVLHCIKKVDNFMKGA